MSDIINNRKQKASIKKIEFESLGKLIRHIKKEGWSNSVIADYLGLSESSIRTFLNSED